MYCRGGKISFYTVLSSYKRQIDKNKHANLLIKVLCDMSLHKEKKKMKKWLNLSGFILGVIKNEKWWENVIEQKV